MQVRTFSVDPAIIYSLISAQAGTLAKALLECIMNSVDAGATEVSVTFDQKALRVVDNGRGFTQVADIEKYFEVFGFSHDDDALQSERVYGQFGIGRAQLWTFASTVWRTGTFQMDVDIKNRGLEYARKDDCPPAAGVTIEGAFYEPLSVRDVMVAEKELSELARYVPVPVTLNGKVVSIDATSQKWTHETDDAWVRIKESGDFAVYNLGVLVRRYPGYHFGCGGELVTKPGVRLALNMARNDVLTAKCPVWRRLQPYVQKQSDAVVRTRRASAGELEAAKQNLVQRALAGELDEHTLYADFFYRAKLITDVTGRHIPVASAIGHITKTWVLAAARKDPRAVKFAEAGVALVLAPETLVRFGVESVEALKAALTAAESRLGRWGGCLRDELAAVRCFESLESAGCELSMDHRLVKATEQTAEETRVLAALRHLQWDITRAVSMQLHGKPREVDPRALRVGLSTTAQAWTDGVRYIAIEREQLKLARTGLPGFIKLTGILVHEYLHEHTSAGSHVHDEDFYANFHDILLSKQGTQLGVLAMRRYAQECRRRGVKLVRAVVESIDLADMQGETADAGDVGDDGEDAEPLAAYEK